MKKLSLFLLALLLVQSSTVDKAKQELNPFCSIAVECVNI